MKFKNRTEAGKLLAKKLIHHQNKHNILILALPRGGVPVAFPIAKKLHVPLDLLLVKKIGVVGYDELAMGAIVFNAPPIFNQEILQQCPVTPEKLNEMIAEKQAILQERNKLYRHNKPAPDSKNKIVIIVDDGIATGASMRAAILAIKNQQPKKIIVAIPVADKAICDELAQIADEVICLYQPKSLSAVGQWYEDFTQVSDARVFALLN